MGELGSSFKYKCNQKINRSAKGINMDMSAERISMSGLLVFKGYQSKDGKCQSSLSTPR